MSHLHSSVCSSSVKINFDEASSAIRSLQELRKSLHLAEDGLSVKVLNRSMASGSVPCTERAARTLLQRGRHEVAPVTKEQQFGSILERSNACVTIPNYSLCESFTSRLQAGALTHVRSQARLQVSNGRDQVSCSVLQFSTT